MFERTSRREGPLEKNGTSAVMVVFLDFDGVLHPFCERYARPFCDLPRFEAVMRSAPAASIVITSSQRENCTLAELSAPFAADIAARIVGATPVLPITGVADLAGSRHREIFAYLGAHPAAEWIAVDDDATLYVPGLANLLLCDDGFGPREAARLAGRLAGIAE
ncbi:HAD domain-containing protein [Paraburkholderia kururiensis]|uniref:HAD domain-containing protein n=1 Tax=Paraburkholderia kururiensis TaxID=984307 RepID=UPI001C3F16D0|nr:HAD domain-containing protein [Paraburkholderia kururiensis]